MSSQLPRHIPDEYVAAWKEMSIDELMKKADRLFVHIETLKEPDQIKNMTVIYDYLCEYIDQCVASKNIDLDSFL